MSTDELHERIYAPYGFSYPELTAQTTRPQQSPLDTPPPLTESRSRTGLLGLV